MKVKPVKVKICKNEKESWDTIWKWQWFMRDTWQHDFRKQEDMVVTRRIVQSVRQFSDTLTQNLKICFISFCFSIH